MNEYVSDEAQLHQWCGLVVHIIIFVCSLRLWIKYIYITSIWANKGCASEFQSLRK